jgi:RHS repeat-associated protein
VQKLDPLNPSTTTVTYVYDAFGNLAAEFGATEPGLTAASGTQYLAMDHLGSTRLVMGAQTERHDYLPFGYEVTGGWRTAGLGYGPNTVPQKFTGQIRDNETGLDFFQARYYAPAQGMFLSPDPANAGADATDPQTWNGYAYVSNNPMANTDPSGLGILSGILSFIGDIFGQDWGGGGNGGPLGGLDNIGGVNSGPWNEQLPISGMSGWTPNPGSVYGSGDAGPRINNETAAPPIFVSGALPIPAWNLGQVADLLAGALDAFTFGTTRWVRRHLPGGDPRDPCSSSPWQKSVLFRRRGGGASHQLQRRVGERWRQLFPIHGCSMTGPSKAT